MDDSFEQAAREYVDRVTTLWEQRGEGTNRALYDLAVVEAVGIAAWLGSPPPPPGQPLPPFPSPYRPHRAKVPKSRHQSRGPAGDDRIAADVDAAVALVASRGRHTLSDLRQLTKDCPRTPAEVTLGELSYEQFLSRLNRAVKQGRLVKLDRSFRRGSNCPPCLWALPDA